VAVSSRADEYLTAQLGALPAMSIFLAMKRRRASLKQPVPHFAHSGVDVVGVVVVAPGDGPLFKARATETPSGETLARTYFN